MVYLDNAATTKIDAAVLETMMPFLTGEYGNPGGLYSMGREAKKAVSVARNQVASLLSCPAENIIFTSSGSESNSMVFHGVASKLLASGKTHILISAIEHSSTIKAATALEEKGFVVELVYPTDLSGCITSEDILYRIKPNTGLISVMYVNNETGVCNSQIEKIGELCKAHGILFHTDCVQAAGQYEIDVEAMYADFVSVSSHKLHGPKGVGALYIRDRSVSPIIFGGSAQEYGLRGGTENVAGIVGFGKACELAKENTAKDMLAVSCAKQAFIGALMSAAPNNNLKEFGIHVNGASYMSPGKILNLCIDGVFGETLVLMMDAYNIAISAGSACNSKEAEPSHVLMAMGLSEDEARSSVRISFSKYNTEDEAHSAATILANCINYLRANLGGEQNEDTENRSYLDDLSR